MFPCTLPQSPLQMLVEIQEQERTQLLKVLGSITPQDLEEKHPKHADDFRSGCIQRLRQIYADLLAQDGARRPRVNQQELKTQPGNELQSKQRVALCRLHLLEEVMELQEVQASALMHKVSRGHRSVPSQHPTLISGFSVFVHQRPLTASEVKLCSRITNLR